MEIGISRRLERVLPRRGSVILPLDGALIDGPTGALCDMPTLVNSEMLQHIDCILGYTGLMKRLQEDTKKVPFIANMSASTVLQSATNKVTIGQIEHAIRSAADAVCFQIHLSDKNESKMLSRAGRLVASASRFGVPVLITVYPRRETDDGIDNYDQLLRSDPAKYAELLTHCVRVAVELGADAVKTGYPGSIDAMKKMTSAALGVPIVIAGGTPKCLPEALERVRDLMLGGAWGVAFGRQIFESTNPIETAKMVRAEINAAIS